MRLLSYFIFLSGFAYCGYSDAAPKGKISELACPYILPAEKDFPANWITVGKIPTEKLQLRTIGIIDQDTSDIPNRNFSEDVIDEWENFKDRSQSVAEYDEKHGNLMLNASMLNLMGKKLLIMMSTML